jgi:phage-related protein
VIDSAVLIIIAVTEGIANALPELIPAVIQCIYTITETLMEHLDEIIAAAQDLFFGIVEGLIQATPTILAEIPTLITSMLEEFGQLGPQLASNALEWGIDMVQNLIDGVRSMFGNLSDAASNLASCISDYLHFSVPEKGPLSDMDVHGGAGLVRSFIEGIEDGSPELEATLNRTLSLPTMAAPELISDMSGTGGNIVIPVNIGQERLDTILIRADQLATYRRGN